MFITDNQGDWVGTSKLHHIKKGNFYGHAGSLVWEKDWKEGRPVAQPMAKLDERRQTAAVLFPHGLMANSPSQPLADSTNGPAFSTSAGLIQFALNERAEQSVTSFRSMEAPKNRMGRFGQWLREHI